MKIVIAWSRGLRTREQSARLSPLLRALAAKASPRDGVIAINWVGERTMIDLNRRYKKRGGASEILTFPVAEDVPDPEGESPRGEIYLCWTRLCGGAKRRRVSRRSYAARLFVHGFFHLRGYRHDTLQSEARMEEAERRFLRACLPAGELKRLFA